MIVLQVAEVLKNKLVFASDINSFKLTTKGFKNATQKMFYKVILLLSLG